MLVLSRRKDERILIGDDIVITVCRINGDRVRVGVEAPDSVPVLRAELVEREEKASQ
jgi:carbon storage regulator